MEEGEGFGKGALQKAQEAFQELEKKYLVLAENMNDGILVIQDNRIKFANARAVQITGYTREELTSPSRVLGTSIHPDDWEAAVERTGRKGREDVPLIHTLRVIDRQGSMKWVEANSVLFEWEGRPASLVFFKDITEREKSEEALNQSEARYRRIVETANEGITDLDENFRITYVNRNMTEMLGFQPEDLLGCPFENFAPEEDRQDTEARRERRRRGLGEKFERALRCKDGTIKWFQVSASAKMDEQDRFLGTFGMFTDITERKRAETNLIKEKERFQTLAESAPFGMVMIDKDGTFEYVNPKFTEILGYDLADVPNGKTWFRKAFPDPGDRHKAIAAWLRDLKTSKPRGKRPAIFTVTCKDGSKKVINFIPVQLGTGENLMTCEDITQRKRTEEELRKSNEQLRALSARLQTVREEERTLVAREIHDELGQFLTALKMDIAWLARKMPKGPNSWVQRAKSMAQLVDTTIDIVRKISAQLRPGLLDDLGLKAAMEWQLQEFQARTGIKCRFTSNREEFSLNREHRTAAFRIFQETLTNVARHAKTSRVEVGLNDQDGSLILEVRDRGKGITKRKVSSPQSLGILGMRERALLLGGEFQIRGVPGKGTTVTVKIPFRRKQATKKNLKTKGRDHD